MHNQLHNFLISNFYLKNRKQFGFICKIMFIFAIVHKRRLSFKKSVVDIIFNAIGLLPEPIKIITKWKRKH